MKFSVLSWNIEHFKGGVVRLKRVAVHIKRHKPDVFALLEIENVNVRTLMEQEFPGYDFALTDGPQVQEILVGWRRTAFEQAVFSQKREFDVGNDRLRPGALLSVKHSGIWYNLLFLHTDSGTDAPAATSQPADTTAPDDTAAADVPVAIVSLAPTHTETLFAIGAGAQVIAVDDQSNYPAEALDKPHDLSGFEPNVEAIAALNPDLVVIADDTKDLTGQLGKLGIAVWVGPAPTSFDDVYTQLEQLGVSTGHVAEAAEVVAQMQTDIAAAVAAAPKLAEPASFYHELDNTLFSVTSNTFIGQVYDLFGLTNIADGAVPGNDYPQLNAEYVISANPNLIFLADSKCCQQTPETVAARPGWNTIEAVQHGGVVAMDDDLASRWGPRLVDYLKAVATAVTNLAGSKV